MHLRQGPMYVGRQIKSINDYSSHMFKTVLVVTPRERKSQLRDGLHQIALWSHLWNIFLVSDWCGRAQVTVGRLHKSRQLSEQETMWTQSFWFLNELWSSSFPLAQCWAKSLSLVLNASLGACADYQTLRLKIFNMALHSGYCHLLGHHICAFCGLEMTFREIIISLFQPIIISSELQVLKQWSESIALHPEQHRILPLREHSLYCKGFSLSPHVPALDFSTFVLTVGTPFLQPDTMSWCNSKA